MTRGRPPLTPAHSIVEKLRRIVADHACRPCPTHDGMAASLKVNIQTVRAALRLMVESGELESYRTASAGGFRRCMRVKVDGRWTDWTALTVRRTWDPRPGEADHLARVLAAGRY